MRDHGRLGRALCHDLCHPGQPGEEVDQRRGIRGCRNNVEVAHGLGPPAHAARLGDAIGGRVGRKLVDDACHERERATEKRPPRVLAVGRGLDVGEGLEHLLLGLGTEAGKLPEPVRLRRLPQLVGARDAELLPQASCRLRPQAGNVHHLDEAGRDVIPELRERRQVAGVGVLDDLPLDRPADARQPRRLPLEGELGNRDGRLPDARCRATVRLEAERVRPVELEQVREQLEHGRQIVVAGKGATHQTAMICPCSSSACRPTTSARTSSG